MQSLSRTASDLQICISSVLSELEICRRDVDEFRSSSDEKICALTAHMCSRSSSSSSSSSDYHKRAAFTAHMVYYNDRYADRNYPKRYINVHKDKITHSRLQKQGTAADTLCDVIRSLLDEREAKQRQEQEEQQRKAVEEAALPAK